MRTLPLWLTLAACPPPTAPNPTETGSTDLPTTTAQTGTTGDTAAPPPTRRPNLMLVLLDDVGVERIPVFDQPHSSWPNTPVIDQLAHDGVRFDRAYATPICSPTRFTALTGRQGRRRGMGAPLTYNEDWKLPLDETTLPQVLAQAGYTSAIAGKWHLATAAPGHATSAIEAGFSQQRGSQGNIGYRNPFEGIVDGVATMIPGYPTTVTADDAIHYAATLPEPWFVWVAFNAAHRPLHVPPAGLNPSGITNGSPLDDRFHALIESADIELGRILGTLDLDDTIVVFLGDNGSHSDHIPTSWEPAKGKGTVYEGGVRVPMIVAGAGIPAGTSTDAIVHSLDVFPTLIELAGIDVDSFSVSTVGHWDTVLDAPGTAPWLDDWDQVAPPVVLDSASFVPALTGGPSARRYLFSDYFLYNGPPPYDREWIAVRDERYKLVNNRGTERFYDLDGRHDDGPDLLETPALTPDEQAAYDRLLGVMTVQLDTYGYTP